MATLYTVLRTLQAQVSAATQGLISSSPDTTGKPLNVEVGLYFPSAKALHNNVRPKNGPGGIGPTALVTIYDRGLAKDSTRWVPSVVSQVVIPATMTVVASESFVQQFASMTLTFGGPVSPGDAVGVVLAQALGSSQAVVAIAGSSDTPSTMAAQLVALLQANPTIMGWLTAVAVGPVVTLTSIVNLLISLLSNVGNGGTQATEIGRRLRHLQIIVWTRTVDDRVTVGDPVEVLIANLEANFGLTFPDGTLGRVLYSGDVMHDEATLSDTMRRDFLVCVDYGINTTNALYAVLAPVVNNTTF
jgi:hypothetical protein